MDASDDMNLLREYATRHSENAFETLVHRHINLVHSVALRQVNDPALAAEVTQTVFLILARKAGSLSSRTILPGWLYRTAQFTASRALRGEYRRRKHEQEAAQMQPDPPDLAWERISPFLDEAMSQLGDADRNAVILRYFENQNLKAVGAALGANEDAARKRIGRALAKLRDFFARRGVTLSLTVMAGALSAQAVQAAPAELATSVAATAVNGTATVSSTALLLKTTLKFMAWTKVKAALVVAAGALVVAGTATVTLVHIQQTGPGSRVRVLPDGSFMRLLSVRAGTTFSYQSSRPKAWQLNLIKQLPSSLASRFDGWLGTGGSRLAMSTPPGVTNLAIFVAHQQPSKGGRGAFSAPQSRLIVFNDEGAEFEAGTGASTVGNDDGKIFKTIEGWMLAAYPRRSKTIGIRFLQPSPNGASNRVIAEFHADNPLFADYPVWPAEPLPDTKTDGDLSVTLTSLASGRVNIPAELGGPSTPGTRATFQFEDNGRSTRAWSPRFITISDATGNVWSPFAPRQLTNREPGELFFTGALWPGEPAFKLRVEFARIADFSPEQLWTVRSLKIPASGETNLLDHSTTIAGSQLRLVAFTGLNADQPGNSKWLLDSGSPRLSIRATPMPRDARLTLVRAVDDRGRRVAIKASPDFGLYRSSEMVYAFAFESGATSVDCTFALCKSRFVEFVAKPEIVPAR